MNPRRALSARGRRRFTLLATSLALAAILAACGGLPPTPQGPKPKSDWFGNLSGAGYHNWHGDFPDGMVMWDPATAKYYGYSTPTGGRNLPIVSSTDLWHWDTRPVYHPSDQPFTDDWFNDGMTKWASWAWEMPARTGVASRKKIWAPHVAKFGNTYVEFYAVVLSDGDNNPDTIQDERFCISYATSTSPLGPFRDTTTTAPLECGYGNAPGSREPSNNPNGTIDPSVQFDASGKAYLIWKTSGAPMPGSNTRLVSRQLAGTKQQWTPGFAWLSTPHELLATLNNSWMGSPGQIEQPAMIWANGSWWLFYSGNNTEDWTYAIGYAHCLGLEGPCAHVTTQNALLSSFNGPHWGPGGGTPFYDAGGGLRMPYHYWANNNPGYEWRADGVYGMRPMAVGMLNAGPFGFIVSP